ncbi:MAG: hypothetical protein HKM89_07895 [Gemmatimonadales bacterium]|nr:hypothetical protein [Gemmatimonadales bacterium]
MTKQDDRRIAALAKKNAAKIKPPTREQSAQYDDTLKQSPEEEESAETKRLFKDMKRREF